MFDYQRVCGVVVVVVVVGVFFERGEAPCRKSDTTWISLKIDYHNSQCMFCSIIMPYINSYQNWRHTNSIMGMCVYIHYIIVYNNYKFYDCTI